MNYRFITILSYAMMTLSVHADVIINEVMQSNIDCIMDDKNQFPDSWVELWNNSSSAVNLSNYKIGLTSDASTAWQLPSQTLAAQSFVIIFCDKDADKLHTNFKLDSGKGGELHLFKNNTRIDSLVNIPKQLAPNISYGRETNGAANIGFMLSPTPGTDNCGTITDNILGNPEFSQKGFVKKNIEGFNLVLTIPADAPSGTEIHYTTDGSIPTETSSLYKSPINISKTTCIRARLFCNGYHSPMPVTESYIFLQHDITLPIISIVSNDKYFYDNKLGILVDGTYNSTTKNYSYNWLRPINIEMYDEDGMTCIANQLCETRVAGNASRGFAQKSLAIKAGKRFGDKYFKYEFFPDQKPGLKKFKSLLLRNAGNDFDYLYMRDAIIQRVTGQNIDVDWQAWKPFIVYINGTYKGILNMRERANEDNIFTNYNELEDIDLYEGWWSLKVGTKDNFEAFRTFYSTHDHTLNDYEKYLDWSEFMNVMISNIYFNNLDFPSNNIEFWRPRTEDGRWRVIMKDTDYSLGIYSIPATYNYIEWLYTPGYDADHNWGNTSDGTRLFRRLMELQEFKDKFLDRCVIYAHTCFSTDNVREIWDQMYEKIKTEYPIHRNLFNRWWPNYSNELSTARTWLSNRSSQFVKMVVNYYQTPALQALYVNDNTSELQGIDITLNDIPLKNGTYSGQFYLGRTVTVSAKPTEEAMHTSNYNVVKAWQITTLNNGSFVTQEYPGDTYSFSMPLNVCKVNAVIAPVTGIDDIKSTSSTPMAYYDLSGQQVTSFQPGRIYIIKYADGTSQKIMK